MRRAGRAGSPLGALVSGPLATSVAETGPGSHPTIVFAGRRGAESDATVGTTAAAADSPPLDKRAPHLLQNMASRLFEWPQAPQCFEPALIAPHCSKPRTIARGRPCSSGRDVYTGHSSVEAESFDTFRR